MNAAHVILDYVEICEKRGEALPFKDFVRLWVIANDLAEEEVSATLLPDAGREKQAG